MTVQQEAKLARDSKKACVQLGSPEVTMVVISRAPSLSSSNLQVFHATDPLLVHSTILVVYGPSATSAAVSSSLARTQTHVFSPAGLQSYPKLSISPGTPLYAAVNCLSREEQGDEIIRAVAYSIFKYFGELSEVAKEAWTKQSASRSEHGSTKLFSASHAASLASRMTPIDNPAKVLQELERALATQVVTSLDLDIVLPCRAIKDLNSATEALNGSAEEELESRYGAYAPLVGLFGETLFLPTAKMQRAPSRSTALNRFTSFAKKQKESLRKEINEMVDTEESYVDKLNELVLDVATDFRQEARSRPPGSSSPDDNAIAKLFPPCLDRMLQVNTSFFEAIRKIAEDTEDAAINDIGATPDSSMIMFQPEALDPSGVTSLADAMSHWLPQFAGCYGDYFQAQPSFAPLLKEFTLEAGSSIHQRVQDTGEQRLLSLLIEPVQRLPRYSLYIDNLVKQLPIRHPALKPLLQVKDVLAGICDSGTPSASSSEFRRIQYIIPSWPASLRPLGRLITAADVVADDPSSEPAQTNPAQLLVVLFAGCLVLARKHGNATAATNFVAEVQKGGTSTWQDQAGSSGLSFAAYKTLHDYSFSHSEDGTTFRMTPIQAPSSRAIVSPDDDRIRQFRLTGFHEGRASRWIADILKARLEARFSEEERESSQWEARETEHSSQLDLQLVSAVFAAGEHQRQKHRGIPAQVRLVIDASKSLKKSIPGQAGIDILASINDEGQGFYRLEVEAPNERSTRDRVTTQEFLPVLVKRRKSNLSPPLNQTLF